MTPAAIPQARPSGAVVDVQMRRPLRTVDLEHRGRKYRIEETIRDQGASVRASGEHVACAGCFKTIAPTTKRLVDGRGLDPHCLPCGIATGLLVRLPECIAAEAVERARAEGIAWA